MEIYCAVRGKTGLKTERMKDLLLSVSEPGPAKLLAAVSVGYSRMSSGFIYCARFIYL